jgi:hypothetical protein
MEVEKWKTKSINLAASGKETDMVLNNGKNGKSPVPRNMKLELIRYDGRKVLASVTKLSR